jgi:hypothetical protein
MIQSVCALAALLGLFLQGSTGGHMLLVEHTRCAEHGELVHGGEAHDHAGSAHAETKTAALHDASDDADAQAHEHCALAVDRQDAIVAIGEAQARPSLDPTRQDVASADIFILADAERFRVAPKNSPPA